MTFGNNVPKPIGYRSYF